MIMPLGGLFILKMLVFRVLKNGKRAATGSKWLVCLSQPWRCYQTSYHNMWYTSVRSWYLIIVCCLSSRNLFFSLDIAYWGEVFLKTQLLNFPKCQPFMRQSHKMAKHTQTIQIWVCPTILWNWRLKG